MVKTFFRYSINHFSVILCPLILCFSILCLSCNEAEPYFPEKHQDLASGTYNKYYSLLDSAYMKDDKIEVAMQLANLKADPLKIFSNLQKGVKADPTKCDKIFQWGWLYDEHNFRVNLVKSDTQQFREVINLCTDLKGKDSYMNYIQNKKKEEEEHEANKPVEDSSKFNMIRIDN